MHATCYSADIILRRGEIQLIHRENSSGGDEVASASPPGDPMYRRHRTRDLLYKSPSPTAYRGDLESGAESTCMTFRLVPHLSLPQLVRPIPPPPHLSADPLQSIA
jgi:hypothetical protein